MKKTILFVLLLLSALCIEASQNERPKVCLNMIVKNESRVIERCLESTKPLIDYWIIVDTGSSDGTQEIIKEYLKDIPGELYERPWVNFEHNRNEAIQLAGDKATYLLFIDADDKLDIPEGYVRPELVLDGYQLKINCGGSTHYRPHLVKTGMDWQWGGVVHEALFSYKAQSIGILDEVTMVIVGGGDRSNDPKKFEKDAEVLENALQKDPASTRNVFYLAQSYRDAGQLESALKNYERRVAMGGWEQEVFWSLYQIAVLQETLELPEDIVSKSYSNAFNYRPSRIEPLYGLSSYYRRNGNNLMGFLVARHGLDIEPSDDPLFVETWIYEYGLLLEYSINAYWIGNYEEAFLASNTLLRMKDLPENVRECVERNLTFIYPKIANEEKTL